MAKCPICNAAAKPRSENSAFPFCTARCKTIDLGKWMSDEYRIPVQGDERDELDGLHEDDDGGASGSSSEDRSKNQRDMRH